MAHPPLPTAENRRPASRSESLSVAGLAALILGGALVVAMIATLVMAFSFFANPGGNDSCTRSGQNELQSRADFVRQHLPAATDTGVWSYDCDSGGGAFLGFNATGSAEERRNAFLRNPACSSWEPGSEDDDDLVGVVCRTDKHSLVIFFESYPPDTDPDTRGNGSVTFQDE